jgi:hypothetical protein
MVQKMGALERQQAGGLHELDGAALQAVLPALPRRSIVDF